MRTNAFATQKMDQATSSMPARTTLCSSTTLSTRVLSGVISTSPSGLAIAPAPPPPPTLTLTGLLFLLAKPQAKAIRHTGDGDDGLFTHLHGLAEHGVHVRALLQLVQPGE